MDAGAERDLRRQSVLLGSQAALRLLTLADGPESGGRVVQARTPQGIGAEFALDRGGDLHTLTFQGVEIGWHSAADSIAPWPAMDAEEGLGFLRGFDGFLVTCGLDHHGVASTTPADGFLYPLRQRNHHPLHGRIAGSKAELVEKCIDWAAGEMRLRLILRQATVFGEVLELHRLWRLPLDRPEIRLTDRVVNRGFRPTRHGILYHLNFGAPFLGPGLRASADWPPAADLATTPPIPSDDHVEVVSVAPSPADGRVCLANPDIGCAVELSFDPVQLPALAMWRAFQSGTFALGIEPQTIFGPDGSMLAGGAEAGYSLNIALSRIA
jgi:hypothetical protein